jgi:hypothetical protein
MEYDNTNSGTFFVNDRKQKPNHPDYSGKINVEEDSQEWHKLLVIGAEPSRG